MKRIILTGARGFIGRQALLPLLERGYEVHAVSSVAPEKIAPDLQFENVFWHQADLLNADEVGNLLQKVEASHLLHFAWYVEHGKFWSSEENYKWVAASFELLKRFHHFGGERIVMAGTCAEYEWDKDDFLSEEKTPLLPSTVYGICKNELRQKMFDFADENSLSAAWGRMFFLYGQHEPPKKLAASVINSLLKDEIAHCSHGNQIRDFLHTKDAAEGFVALLDSKVNGCFNIASGEGKTIKEVVSTIGEILGKLEKIRFAEKSLPDTEPKRIVADVTKILNEISWKPRSNLLQRLEETIAWWKGR